MNNETPHVLICATSNAHKLREMRAILPPQFELMGLKDIGHEKEISEDQDTITGNAIQKAQTLYDELKVDCFSEDSGLEVDALNGAPGVHSARYAGPARDDLANLQKVLLDMSELTDRGAQYRTVIALIWKGDVHIFEGIVRGTLRKTPKGDEGFGYDPIFIPEGYEKSFGELPAEVKQKISHRTRAFQKLMKFLSTK